MADLNTLVPVDSPVYMLIGSAINDLGQIVGFGVDNFGDVHGYLATPCSVDHADTAWCNADIRAATGAGAETTERPRKVPSEHARELLRQRLRFRLPGDPPVRAQ